MPIIVSAMKHTTREKHLATLASINKSIATLIANHETLTAKARVRAVAKARNRANDILLEAYLNKDDELACETLNTHRLCNELNDIR